MNTFVVSEGFVRLDLISVDWSGESLQMSKRRITAQKEITQKNSEIEQLKHKK
jgi:hypothetical protein